MEEKIKHTIDISKILSLHTSGEDLNDIEQKQLNAWLKESEANKQLLDDLKSKEKSAQRRQIIANINMDKEWSNFQRAIAPEKKVISLKWMNVLKYAAVIALPLIIGTYLFLQVDQQKEDFVADVPVEILPGVKKAQLVLSNGERVELSKVNVDLSIQEKGVKIENKEEALNYATVENLKGELRYNHLIIGRGEEYRITLADGTKVWLNSESKLKYPIQFAANIREVELEGEGYFEVTKNSKAPFIVKTNQMNVEVLGTAFNISAYTDESRTETTLVEGSVKIAARFGSIKSIIIKPDEQAVYDGSFNELEVKKVDARSYGRWREGVFSFNEDNLEEIMRKLSRWYDIRVFFADNEARNYQFSGKLPRFESCNELLEMIEKTTNVQFEIKNGENVIVSKRR
jgi:ferric-dicitrate binding protein FerR (iron transport regulator)